MAFYLHRRGWQRARALPYNLMKPVLKLTARMVWGVLLSSVLAVVASYAFAGWHHRLLVPVGFVVVLVLVSLIFGTMAGVLGSICSAFIFAYLLCPPLRSVSIESQAARQSLSWMVLGGIAIPYLLLPGIRAQRELREDEREDPEQSIQDDGEDRRSA